MNYNPPSLNTIVFDDAENFIDMLYREVGVYIDIERGLTFEVIVREILNFSIDDYGKIYWNQPVSRYPMLDWNRLNYYVQKWTQIILKMMPEMKFIELIYHQNLVNGIEFMVLHFENKPGLTPRWM